ncbi:S9 family peptidase [Myroides sp. WP-1]|uniref:alpha/beta hydrolase family protein n=1 Tax=Myroides sp. WP-1 TaxID=2759944 RepID=UPI0015FAAE17|nr:alpha/beta hydrolase [Myroides sp. WP-1]MBB1138012.1 alpha/beta hydrolase [Myroides sp. WP-1]
MKKSIVLLVAFLGICSFAQTKTAEELGFEHRIFKYREDQVDVVIKSKQGEEHTVKPLLFFCQGSTPEPVLKYYKDKILAFPVDMEDYIEQYHLVFVGKPGIPLVVDLEEIGPPYSYMNTLDKIPTAYTERNYLDYYVERNIEILKDLEKEDWVAKDRLIVVGHSEGSTIAAKMAALYPKITHLIYSGGNPMGRILAIISELRYTETQENQEAERLFDHWDWIVENKDSTTDERGDSPKATYAFSQSSMSYFKEMKIPVLVTYGSKDWSAPFNDYLRVEAIKEGWKNFTFKAYVGTEHNFFPVDEKYIPDHSVRNWPKVGEDWLVWLNEN